MPVFIIAIFVSLFLIDHLAYAAVTCGNGSITSNAAPGSSTTISYATPVGSNLLLVGVGNRNGPPPLAVSSVTHAGNAMTATLAADANSTAGAVLYYIVNPTAGTNNVVVTFPGPPLAEEIIIFACSGVNMSAPIRFANSANGSSTTPSVTATTQAGDLVVDFFFSSLQTTAPTVGADQTIISSGTDTSESAAGASFQDGGLGGVMSWTIASHSWASQAVSLAPAVSASRRNMGPMVLE